MSAPAPYIRPVPAYWWARPPYLAYTVREAAGGLIALYGLVLLAGVIALAMGESAYDGWLRFLQSPWSIVLHLLILGAMILHVQSWFAIMPKTMPRLVIGGRYLEQRRITIAGLIAAVVANVVLLLIAILVQP